MEHGDGVQHSVTWRSGGRGGVGDIVGISDLGFLYYSKFYFSIVDCSGSGALATRQHQPPIRRRALLQSRSCSCSARARARLSRGINQCTKQQNTNTKIWYKNFAQNFDFDKKKKKIHKKNSRNLYRTRSYPSRRRTPLSPLMCADRTSDVVCGTATEAGG